MHQWTQDVAVNSATINEAPVSLSRTILHVYHSQLARDKPRDKVWNVEFLLHGQPNNYRYTGVENGY